MRALCAKTSMGIAVCACISCSRRVRRATTDGNCAEHSLYLRCGDGGDVDGGDVDGGGDDVDGGGSNTYQW